MSDRGMRLRDRLCARRHTALLVALIAAFAVRPLIVDERTALAAFTGAIVVLMMVSLYALQVGHRVATRWE